MPRNKEELARDCAYAQNLVLKMITDFGIELIDVAPDQRVRGYRVRYCDRGGLRLRIYEPTDGSKVGVDSELTVELIEIPSQDGARSNGVGLSYPRQINFPDLVGESVWTLESDIDSLSLLLDIHPDLASVCDYLDLNSASYTRRSFALRTRIAQRQSQKKRMAPDSPFYLGFVLHHMLRCLVEGTDCG